MLNQKSVLARLLANENITVQQGNFETAYFDVKTRVLGLPLWKDMGKDVYDMLVGHEVSHALFTPQDFNKYMSEGIPHSWLNVVEDVRIEKLILRKYPGLVGNFKRGYIHLMRDLDLFGVKDKLDQLHKLPFMDRLNLHAKARDLLDVPFADDELPFVAQAKACETYEDVVQCCRDIQAWLGEKAQDAETDNHMDNQSVNYDSDADGESISSDASNDDQDAEEQDGSGEGEGEPSDEEGEQEGKSGASDTGEQTDDESDTPAEASEEADGDETDDQQSGENGKPETPESGEMDQEALTDVNWNQKSNELLSDSENTYVQGLTKAEADASTIPYSVLAKARIEDLSERKDRLLSLGLSSRSELAFPETEYAQFLRETKQVVNLMVKEFEMRKAAYRSARARTSTRGTLDVNKLHRYKYDDHLFKQVRQLADAKNHGMMMLIDYSGSMHNSLPAVQRQLLALLMFCKRVAIPFEVYAFTSVGGDAFAEMRRAKEAAKPAVTHVNSEELALLELFNSSMTKRDYEEAFKMVFWQAHTGFYRSVATSRFEDLGNTPLNTALMAMQYKIEAFRAKHRVEKMNFITLTDGDSNNLWVRQGVDLEDRYIRTRNLLVEVNGKVVKMPARSYGRSTLDVTAALVQEIEKMGCSTMNYFVAYDNRDVNGAIRQAITFGGWNDNYRGDFNSAKRDIRNKGVAIFDNNLGYQRRFILPIQDAAMQGEIEDLDVDSGMTAKKIAKQFGKSNGSKKKSRVVTQKFAELIA